MGENVQDGQSAATLLTTLPTSSENLVGGGNQTPQVTARVEEKNASECQDQGYKHPHKLNVSNNLIATNPTLAGNALEKNLNSELDSLPTETPRTPFGRNSLPLSPIMTGKSLVPYTASVSTATSISDSTPDWVLAKVETKGKIEPCTDLLEMRKHTQFMPGVVMGMPMNKLTGKVSNLQQILF